MFHVSTCLLSKTHTSSSRRRRTTSWRRRTTTSWRRRRDVVRRRLDEFIYDVSRNYTVVQKNAPTLADYNYDKVQSILIIFSELFANDHKIWVVLKFFTSPHICCHYTLWNTMLYFALMTLFIAKILVFFWWLWKEPVNYWNRCSNWRPFAFTHARSLAVHWSTASSTTHCGMLAHVSTRLLLQVDCVTDRRFVQTLLHQAPNAVIDCSNN